MSSIEFVGLKRILENSNADIIKVCSTLVKIFMNILKTPSEVDSRRIRLDNPDIMDNLMPYSGGLETLFEIGFLEVDDIKIILKMFDL